ncbi:MAG: DsbA family protein [Candidatus Nomurabacteria bacterium]|jgi:protein-disulfide isomerase|nr:DsbA family protein [Candidatus Nomurabacteria bacterium]
MNKRVWIVFAIIVIALFGGLVWYKRSSHPDETNVDISHLNIWSLITKDELAKSNAQLAAGEPKAVIPDHYRGPVDAKVRVIEYEDYGCVHCHQFAATLKKIRNKYDNRVLFIYRSIIGTQPNSGAGEKVAEAAYLVGGEDAYWKMHDLFFADMEWGQDAIPASKKNTLIHSYAQQIGLNKQDFDNALNDYDNNGILEKNSRDRKLANSNGASGTPTFFVYDANDTDAQARAGKVEVVPSGDGSELTKAIDKALKQAGEK